MVSIAVINRQAIAVKTKRAIGLWLVLVSDFVIPGTNPGKESVFKQHLMNCKHLGNTNLLNVIFNEVAKLWLIFVNNKYCFEKVKKCCVLGSTIVSLSGNQWLCTIRQVSFFERPGIKTLNF